MRILRREDYKVMPWKNGVGTTTEIAVFPPESGLSGAPFQWRVSIADVAKAGDFSAFPGMERVLTVIEGELLLLTVGGAEQPLEKYRPFRFDGGAATTAALPTGDIRDLNVITRTGAFIGTPLRCVKCVAP